jgi:hypothetical protein
MDTVKYATICVICTICLLTLASVTIVGEQPDVD